MNVNISSNRVDTIVFNVENIPGHQTRLIRKLNKIYGEDVVMTVGKKTLDEMVPKKTQMSDYDKALRYVISEHTAALLDMMTMGHPDRLMQSKTEYPIRTSLSKEPKLCLNIRILRR